MYLAVKVDQNIRVLNTHWADHRHAESKWLLRDLLRIMILSLFGHFTDTMQDSYLWFHRVNWDFSCRKPVKVSGRSHKIQDWWRPCETSPVPHYHKEPYYRILFINVSSYILKLARLFAHLSLLKGCSRSSDT